MQLYYCLYARPPPFVKRDFIPHFKLKRQTERTMNILKMDKQTQILSALVEGNSIRATARITGVEHKTVMRVLIRASVKCEPLLNERMRSLPCKIVQVDEIWTFVGKKEKNVRQTENPELVGDQYVFVALDSESKIVPTFRVGKRNAENAWYFMQDLQERLTERVQLTTDGFRPYRDAVEDAFGASVDYAMLVKMYGSSGEAETRYSPGEIVDARPIPITGRPKMHLISTSHIERQNLTIRMQMRRFTRLTNGFSKKLENLKAMLCLYFAWYNFCRVHQTLRITPAMAAGITEHVWTLEETTN
jgi:IS1 family transposase